LDEFNTYVTKQSNAAQSFHGYGSDFIKASGHAPDAFVQSVIQLATFRLFGEQVGTYEATQVRPFLVRKPCGVGIDCFTMASQILL
jgi:carnitine O-acetyltransferase